MQIASSWFSLEIIDADANLQDNLRLECGDEFCWFYTPYEKVSLTSTFYTSLSDEST